MQNVLDKLAENMQVIYRKAIDADNSLNKLQQSGQGKFNLIFPQDAGFSVSSKRFMPYVEELAKQVAELAEAGQQKLQIALPDIVRKMELLLKTLTQFQQSIKG